MADASGSDRRVSPQEEERQRVMGERVARREEMVRQRVTQKRAEQARRRAIWARRTAIGKLFIFLIGLVVAAGLLVVVTTWFGVNVNQVLTK